MGVQMYKNCGRGGGGGHWIFGSLLNYNGDGSGGVGVYILHPNKHLVLRQQDVSLHKYKHDVWLMLLSGTVFGGIQLQCQGVYKMSIKLSENTSGYVPYHK